MLLAAACMRLRMCRSAVAQLRFPAPVQAAASAQGVPFMLAAQLSAVAAPQPEPSQGPFAGAWQPLPGAHPHRIFARVVTLGTPNDQQGSTAKEHNIYLSPCYICFECKKCETGSEAVSR